MAHDRFTGIQFESLRRVVDPPFNDVYDRLRASYVAWREGRSRPFVQKGATADLNLATGHVEFQRTGQPTRIIAASALDAYNRLDAILHAKYDLSFEAANQQQPPARRIADDAWNPPDSTGARRAVKARAQLTKERAAGFDLDV